jgi:hypothetical protein
MKAIVAILLLATTGAAQAETGKPADQPVTVHKAGKPYIFDGARTPYRAGMPYIDDRLQMRQLLPSGFRSDAPEASPDSAQDKPTPVIAPAPKRPG